MLFFLFHENMLSILFVNQNIFIKNHCPVFHMSKLDVSIAFFFVWILCFHIWIFLISFFLIATQYSTVWKNHYFFKHFTTDRHLDCLHLFPIRNNTVNLLVTISTFICLNILSSGSGIAVSEYVYLKFWYIHCDIVKVQLCRHGLILCNLSQRLFHLSSCFPDSLDYSLLWVTYSQNWFL